MKHVNVSIPKIGLIAATRGMAGAGAGMLITAKLSVEKRKKIGWPLLLIGALSTVPILLDVLKKEKSSP